MSWYDFNVQWEQKSTKTVSWYDSNGKAAGNRRGIVSFDSVANLSKCDLLMVNYAPASETDKEAWEALWDINVGLADIDAFELYETK